MTKLNSSTCIESNSTSFDFSKLVQERNGCYKTKKMLTADEIIFCAKHLIAQTYQREGSIMSTSASKDYFIAAFAKLEEENFCVLFLDHKNSIIAFEKLFTGTINQANIYPRVIIKRALAHNAAAVILAHNHPSGDASPSHADIAMTKKMKALLADLDIRVLDHVIVAGCKTHSLLENGNC